MEAMAAGRPVICLDVGGPAHLVSDESGIRVPALRPQETIAGLARAMARLAADPNLVDRMGKAARKRASEAFTWEGKGEQMRRLYESLGGVG